MKQGFQEYLASLELTDPVKARVESVLEFYAVLAPEEIESIFVTDYLDQNGARFFESLWLFSKGYVMEAKQFISQDDFDIGPLGRLFWIAVRKENYDFKTATAASRLNIEYRNLASEFGGQLRASGKNCDNLRQVLVERLVPRLTTT
jgi:hypothetical protein